MPLRYVARMLWSPDGSRAPSTPSPKSTLARASSSIFTSEPESVAPCA
jgi:hypothetical protein